jgi:hypothetical protein
LREAANHFAGYVWTFAKTLTQQNESPRYTASRAVLEKTGYTAHVRASIPGIFKGSASTTVYFLMDASHPPVPYNSHTSGLRWAGFDEARELIRKTSNAEGRERDLALLDAVQRVVKQRPYREHLNVQPEDFWGPLGLISERPVVLHPKLHFNADDLTRIRRGFCPTIDAQKGFIYFSENCLRMHRSWSGLLFFSIGFVFHDDGSSTISEVIINRDDHVQSKITPDTDTDPDDLQLMEDVIRYHLLEPLDAPAVDSFLAAFSVAQQPNYLGSTEVVSEFVQGIIDVALRLIVNEAEISDVDNVIVKVADAMAGELSEYTKMEGWHTTSRLGVNINKYLLADAGVGGLHQLVCQGLEAMTTKALAILKCFLNNPAVTWERHGLPQLNALKYFVVAVHLGTNTVHHEGKLLGDFVWSSEAG